MKAAFTLTLLTLLAGADAPADPARDATVKVTGADGRTGSGTVVGRGGPDVYVLTAAHVVRDGKAAAVTLADGKERKAEVVAADAGPDLAVVRFAAAAPPALKLAPAGAAPKAVASLGWEAGAAPTRRAEAVKAKAWVRRPGEAAAVLCWETEQRPAPGRSGGALVDEAGRLIGVAAGHDGATGFYTHADEVRAFLRRAGLRWLTDDGR